MNESTESNTRSHSNETIGIIAAMDVEVDLLAANMDRAAVAEIAGVDFMVGSIKSRPAVLARCGVGKVNAAMATQIMIDWFEVTNIVNTGVAGAIDEELSRGDILVADQVSHHDMNAQPLGYDQGQIPMEAESSFTPDATTSQALLTAASMLGSSHVTTGHIVSGDIFVSSQKTKDAIARMFDAACCDMESAAIAQVCHANGIPFGVIRTVSDNADGDTGDYAEFEEEAARTSAQIVLSFLEF